MRAFINAILVILAILLLACVEPVSPIDETIATVPSPRPKEAEDALKVAVLGDSIAAGLGLAERDAFPAVTEELLRAAGYPVRVVNAGVSGDTSAGGLRRIEWILQQQPDVVVVELGGNDALRGQPLQSTENNLREIVSRSLASGARVVLLGMDVPTNYGPDYASAFAELYERIAREEQISLVPGFMREVGIDPQLMQPDGLHPTAEGQRALADRLVPALEPLLHTISGDGGANGQGRHEPG